MTEEDRIQKLKTAPLKIPLVGWDRFWQVVQRVCAVISVLAMATATVGIALVFQLAICTNTNLGQRQKPATDDARAHIAYAAAEKMFDKAETVYAQAQAALAHSNAKLRDAVAEAVHATTAAQKAKATADFVTAFFASAPAAAADQAAADAMSAASATKQKAADAYASQLETDQKARESHPLGKC